MQFHGATGYMQGTAVERMYRATPGARHRRQRYRDHARGSGQNGCRRNTYGHSVPVHGIANQRSKTMSQDFNDKVVLLGGASGGSGWPPPG